MTDDTVVEWIQSKYENLAGDLDERARRRWAAVEALSLGRGGIAAVAAATGISDRTIRNGIREMREGDTPPTGRQRRIGRQSSVFVDCWIVKTGLCIRPRRVSFTPPVLVGARRQKAIIAARIWTE